MAILTWSIVLASLISLATAANSITYDICLTEVTSQLPHSPIPTTTYFQTIVIPHDVYVTTTPGLTITPSVVTSVSTITSTVTTKSSVTQVTDTFTSTIAASTTITLTAPTTTFTTTATSFTTSTSAVSATTTIAPPPGFQPVLDTLPDSAAKHKRSMQGGSAAVLAKRALQQQYLAVCSNGKGKAPPSYPAKVICAGVVERFAETTITKTAKTTTKATASTPSTIVYTTVSTTTTAIVPTPHALTTVTTTQTNSFTTTVTPSTTTTPTITSTIVIPSYTATAYAICQDSSNYAGTVMGGGISAIGGNAVVASTNDTSAEACCNSCAANPLCDAPLFDGANCVLFLYPSDDVCSFGMASFSAFYGSGNAADEGYIVSNGNCGAYNQIQQFVYQPPVVPSPPQVPRHLW